MRLRPFAFVALALLVTVCTPHAQTPVSAPAAAFTAEDILKVTTLSVLDVSYDGRRVAAAARRAYDNAEIDNRRYGDPTYVAPATVRLMVIDTETGAIDTPLGERADLRQAAWSRDGKQLALLVLAGAAPGAAPAVRLQILGHREEDPPGRGRQRRRDGGRQLRRRMERGRQEPARVATFQAARRRGEEPIQGVDRGPGHRPEREGAIPRVGRPRPRQSLAIARRD